MTRLPKIQRRAMRFGHVLTWCTDWHTDSEGLIEWLTDALHWTDANGEDFLIAFAKASERYLHELRNESTNERKLP